MKTSHQTRKMSYPTQSVLTNAKIHYPSEKRAINIHAKTCLSPRLKRAIQCKKTFYPTRPTCYRTRIRVIQRKNVFSIIKACSPTRKHAIQHENVLFNGKKCYPTQKHVFQCENVLN